MKTTNEINSKKKEKRKLLFILMVNYFEQRTIEKIENF